MIVSIDFETRSTVDLKKRGVYPYAADPSTDILCMAYAFGDEEPSLWISGRPFPDRLEEHIAAGGEMRAWNVQFERVMWSVMRRKYGAPPVRLEQWMDTAAEAAAMALPRGLNQCAQVLGLAHEFQKDAEGYRLMLKMCKPRAPKKGEPDGLYWIQDAESLARLGEYCKQDVRTERRISQCVRRLSPFEKRIFWLDQTINDRGMHVDRQLIAACQSIAAEGIQRAANTLSVMTNGMVEGPTKREALKRWLATQKLTVPSLAKDPLAKLLDTELEDHVRTVLTAYAESAKTSIGKLKSMLTVAGTDDVMRGLLLYCGAGTGRWSGRLVQPHNFARPTHSGNPECFIPAVLRGNFDELAMLDNPIDIVVSLLRSCMQAEPGMEYIEADYSGIEARITNWLAGQWDIVDLFARGEDVYFYNAKNMAAMSGAPLPEWATKKTHPNERQVGKAVELGCGFGMGGPKFMDTANKEPYNLGIDLKKAKEFVAFYRESHPAVAAMWKALNHCAISAVADPGSTHSCGEGARIRFTQRGGYLWMILPSGRALCYARPRIEEVEAPWSTEEKRIFLTSVTAWGVDSETRSWQKFKLYGGLLMENAVQAIARDVMAEGMVRVEEKGYPVHLTVHDSVLAQVVRGYGSVTEFEGLLSILPAWAQTGQVPCPITAEGWRGSRYRK